MGDNKSGFGGEVVKGLLGPLTEPYSDAVAVVLGDRIANWRLRNVMRAHAKTQAEAERLGLKLRPDKVPNRFAFTWFEEVSKHDDDELQTLFARLLAATASGEVKGDDRLVRILGQLSPQDAKVFEYYYETPKGGQLETLFHARSMGYWGPIERRHFTFNLKKKFGNDCEIEMESLVLAGCMSQFITTQPTTFPARVHTRNLAKTDWEAVIRDQTKPVEYVSHTNLGWNLARAVLSDVASMKSANV